ncbi:MAG: 3-methylcrotonyl-CoA carboxylase, partial [Acidobacteriia bacterium]|nr:3-methylcrotonyl-CoA carboxylase [Terriglobia bacterium]
DYRAGEFDTSFLERRLAALIPGRAPISREELAAALLAVLAEQRRESEKRAAASGDPWSPWNELNCWRMNEDGFQDIPLSEGEARFSLRVFPRADASLRVQFPTGVAEIAQHADTAFLDGVKLQASAIWDGGQIVNFQDGATRTLEFADPLAPPTAAEESGGTLTAPMPGRIVQVLVEKGARVRRGAPLVILEAMKMEYTITDPADGTIAAVCYAPGAVVQEGTELIAFGE